MSHDLTTLTDFHLRYALKQSLYARFANNPQVLIVDELGLQNGLARIDVAVIGSYFHGFELKSDRDSLERLPRQVKIYNSVLERVTLVVGYRHLYEALHLIPKWWGVKLAEVTFNHRVHLYSTTSTKQPRSQ